MQREQIEQPIIEPTGIPGWGIDADPQNEPTYPMRQRTELDHAGYSWERPTQQPETIEVLRSNERPNLPAVFGEAAPPSGLSGVLRRFAFRFSESSYWHWLPLILADRINMVEGVIHDLSRGHIPNIAAERGWGAEWRHNRTNFLLRIAGYSGALAAVAALLLRRRRG